MAVTQPARPAICGECPWRRDSVPGYLGPASPQAWQEAIHSDHPIFCHLTIVPPEGQDHADPDDDRLQQCAGAAQARTNMCKVPRDPTVATADRPDTVNVFATSFEFVAHHDNGALRTWEAE